MMKIAFSLNKRDPEITSFLISLFTWSKCFHCELIFSDGKSLRCDSNGVYWSTRPHPYYLWTVLPLPDINEEQENMLRARAEKIVASNAKYDWFGAILGKFSPYWNNLDRWFCSELCVHLLNLVYADINELTDTTKKYWTPEMLWKEIGTHLTKEGISHETVF